MVRRGGVGGSVSLLIAKCYKKVINPPNTVRPGLTSPPVYHVDAFSLFLFLFSYSLWFLLEFPALANVADVKHPELGDPLAP